MALVGDAGDPRGEQQEQPGDQAGRVADQLRQVDQQRRAEGDAEGNQPHAAQRRQSGQRAVQLAVAGKEPREAGEEPAAEQLQAQPQRGEGEGVADRRVVAAQGPGPDPGRQGEEEGHAGTEAGNQEGRQRTGGAAEVVDAVVDPAGPGHERAEAVPPAAPERRAGRGVAQAEVEQGDGEQGQRPVVERSEEQRGEGAGGESQ
ncbi:hypothetical protein D3C81_1239420 [compost metagenome]